jgi:hypothetical protein
MHFCASSRILHVLLISLSRTDHISESTESAALSYECFCHVPHLVSKYSQQPSSVTKPFIYVLPLKLEKNLISMKAIRKIIVSTSPPSVSRLSRKCGSLDILRSYEALRPVTGRAVNSFKFSFILTHSDDRRQ